MSSDYMITNDMQAERALRRIRGIRAERERLLRSCDEQIAIYTRRKELLLADSNAREEYYTGKLNEYYASLPEAALAHTKAGNTVYRLLGGSLKTLHPKVELEHNDDQLLYDLLAAGRNDLIKSTSKPKWGELKPLLQVSDNGEVYIEVVDEETGECIRHSMPGVTAASRPSKFEVVLDKLGDVDMTEDEEDEYE